MMSETEPEVKIWVWFYLWFYLNWIYSSTNIRFKE